MTIVTNDSIGNAAQEALDAFCAGRISAKEAKRAIYARGAAPVLMTFAQREALEGGSR